jgi:hypothetical protein
MEKKKFILTEEHKQNAFTVPEGYFETMQDRLIERISVETQPQPGWWQALRPQLTFAAGFVALVIMGYGGLYLLNSLKETSSGAMYDDDLYAAAADMLKIDEDAVLRVLSEEKHSDSSVDTDAIINYLADANISIADIASLN